MLLIYPAITIFVVVMENFWKDTGWIAGFSEMPRGSHADFMDVGARAGKRP